MSRGYTFSPPRMNQVLAATDDLDVAVVVHRGQVTRVHPPGRVDRLGGPLVVVPVAEHHRVAARAQLAGGAAGHHRVQVIGIEDLDLDVRVHPTHGRRPLLEVVVGTGLGRHRRGPGAPRRGDRRAATEVGRDPRPRHRGDPRRSPFSPRRTLEGSGSPIAKGTMCEWHPPRKRLKSRLS